MTNYDKITKNKESLIKFISQNSCDDSDWENWFNEKYCQNCEPVELIDKANHRSHWCQYCDESLYNKCKYFEYIGTLTNEQVLEFYFDEEIKEN